MKDIIQWRSLILYGGLTIVCIAMACDSTKNDQTTKEDVVNELNEAMDTVKAYTLEEKDQFLKDIKVKIDNTRVRIKELKGKLVDMKQAQKQALEAKLSELEKMQLRMEQEINGLSSASEEAYHDLRNGLDSAMTVLENSLTSANEEFKK